MSTGSRCVPDVAVASHVRPDTLERFTVWTGQKLIGAINRNTQADVVPNHAPTRPFTGTARPFASASITVMLRPRAGRELRLIQTSLVITPQSRSSR